MTHSLNCETCQHATRGRKLILCGNSDCYCEVLKDFIGVFDTPRISKLGCASHSSAPVPEGKIKCPVCGAPTWIRFADGHQTIFCYSGSCYWNQQIRETEVVSVQSIRQDEREKVLDELSREFIGKTDSEIKDIMFFKQQELRQEGKQEEK